MQRYRMEGLAGQRVAREALKNAKPNAKYVLPAPMSICVEDAEPGMARYWMPPCSGVLTSVSLKAIEGELGASVSVDNLSLAADGKESEVYRAQLNLPMTSDSLLSFSIAKPCKLFCFSFLFCPDPGLAIEYVEEKKNDNVEPESQRLLDFGSET